MNKAKNLKVERSDILVVLALVIFTVMNFYTPEYTVGNQIFLDLVIVFTGVSKILRSCTKEKEIGIVIYTLILILLSRLIINLTLIFSPNLVTNVKTLNMFSAVIYSLFIPFALIIWLFYILKIKNKALASHIGLVVEAISWNIVLIILPLAVVINNSYESGKLIQRTSDCILVFSLVQYVLYFRNRYKESTLALKIFYCTLSYIEYIAVITLFYTLGINSYFYSCFLLHSNTIGAFNIITSVLVITILYPLLIVTIDTIIKGVLYWRKIHNENSELSKCKE